MNSEINLIHNQDINRNYFIDVDTPELRRLRGVKKQRTQTLGIVTFIILTIAQFTKQKNPYANLSYLEKYYYMLCRPIENGMPNK